MPPRDKDIMRKMGKDGDDSKLFPLHVHKKGVAGMKKTSREQDFSIREDEHPVFIAKQPRREFPGYSKLNT